MPNLVVFLTNHYSSPHVCASFVLLVQAHAKCWRTDATRYGSWPNRFFGSLGLFSDKPELAEKVYGSDYYCVSLVHRLIMYTGVTLQLELLYHQITA